MRPYRKKVIKRHYLISNTPGHLYRLFNPLMSPVSLLAERGKRRPCGLVWRGLVIDSDAEKHSGITPSALIIRTHPQMVPFFDGGGDFMDGLCSNHLQLTNQ